MKKLHKIFLLVLLILCCRSVCAKDDNSYIPVSNLKAGDNVEVYIVSDGIENLYSYACKLIYNPEEFKFIGSEALMFGKHTKSGVMDYNTSCQYEYGGRLTGYSRYEDKPGQLYYVITRLGTQSKALDKNLAKITFCARKDIDGDTGITIEKGSVVLFDSTVPVKNEINTDECFTTVSDEKLKYRISVK